MLLDTVYDITPKDLDIVVEDRIKCQLFVDDDDTVWCALYRGEVFQPERTPLITLGELTARAIVFDEQIKFFCCGGYETEFLGNIITVARHERLIPRHLAY